MVGGSKEFEEQLPLPEYDLPPLEPQRPVFQLSIEGHPIWEMESAEKRFYDRFENPKYRHGLEELVGAVGPDLEQRWQLGYTPRLIHSPGGEVEVEFPKFDESSLNNRRRHSVEVASIVVDLGEAADLPESERFLLGVAGILHDYKHLGFSHIGENFMKHLVEKGVGDDGYEDIFKKWDLDSSHEDRLVYRIEDSESELYEVLERIGIHEEEKVKLLEILSEKGLGFLLSIADTSAYLNLDSVFFGYTPPHFEKHFAEIVTGNGDNIFLKSSTRTTEIVRRFATYRKEMYLNHYFHPLTEVYVKAQVLAFEAHFYDLPNDDTRDRFLQDLLEKSDKELLILLRKRTLMEGEVLGASFFGIPVDGARIMREGEQLSLNAIVVGSNDNGRSKVVNFPTEGGGEIIVDINDLVEKSRANSPLPEDTTIVFDDKRSFIEVFKPLFQRFIEMSKVMHGKGALKHRDFVDAFGYGSKGRPHDTEFAAKLMQLAEVDVAFRYRAEDAMDFSALKDYDSLQEAANA